MPTATHSIDAYQFLCLKGEVVTAQEELDEFNRGGVDNTTFKKLGSRGRPFQLLSIVDAPDLDDAKVGFLAYVALTATTVTLIKDGINWGTFVVKRVDIAPNGMKAVANFAGGINPPSTAMLACVWTLHAI